MAAKTIGIFPAAGKLAGSTLRHLLKFVPADQVILVCRHPDKIPDAYVQAGARVRQASYGSTPSELEEAFAGIDVLLLISYPSHVHVYRTMVQLPAVDAARRAGVQHLLYSSLAFAGPADNRQSKAVVMQAHLDTEQHLRDAAAEAREAQVSDPAAPPFRFTSIREGLYAESVPIYTAFFDPAADTSGVIRIPHDGAGPGIAWARIDDLGEATARLVAAAATADVDASEPALAAARRCLADDDIILLTGPRAWTLAETVAAVYGKAVHVEAVSVNEYAAQPAVRARFGGGGDLAQSWATAWDAIRAGETAVVTTTLADILGREPQEAFARSG